MISPEYAKIKFEYSLWDLKESGELVYTSQTVESHACSEEELGLTGDNSKFFPIHETSSNYVSLYKKKFQCINQEDLEIYGNFNSKKAQLLRVRLNYCQDEVFCRNKDEIDAFMKS